MKSDCIKIISNIAYHCPDFRDEFRIKGGIPFVLSNCILDDLNPFIREASLFCLRNLSLDNTGNQELIRGLEAKQMAPNLELESLSLKVTLDSETGKPIIKK
jgi:hypothetical protein